MPYLRMDYFTTSYDFSSRKGNDFCIILTQSFVSLWNGFYLYLEVALKIIA